MVAEKERRGIGHQVHELPPDGELLMSLGTGPIPGDGPDHVRQPATGSEGRIFVADRGNYRIQIFDQERSLLDVWTRFGKPDRIFIDADDMPYVTDAKGANTGWEHGIRDGDARTGWVETFIMSPFPADASWGWEGVTADACGNIYAAEPRLRWTFGAPSTSRGS